ncbi:uncharacterized protein B0P05DRAFT_546429 [Gilbertella persicaria]|uniref:uncharacterized protein n=1 Tax=Gilbertella persicaria TaxID=101096 RepID=UPI00221FA2FA|nr:uncharacterized protein B0P05DRAFT_546429 [Gilbertella persicaria]KAI8075793.1 hypothetical protein B0P05DRAFT_546429 [Gilbertella persicaria]
MNSWCVLPNEILEYIFQHVDTETATQCQRVCHHWNAVAQKATYSHITIHNLSQMKLLMRTLMSCSVGQYVKQLCIKGVFDPLMLEKEIRQKTFHVLASLTPRLQGLSIPWVSVKFWACLRTALLNGYWKQLDTVPQPTSMLQMSDYGLATTMMSNRIKSIQLYITYDMRMYQNDDSSVALWTHHLRAFHYLESLFLKNDKRSPLHAYDTMIDACPTLKQFKLATHHQGLAIIEHSFFRAKSVVPNYSISHLELVCDYLSRNDLVYLIQKFKTLKHLMILHEDNKSWHLQELNGIDFDIVVQFHDYIRKLETFNAKIPSSFLNQQLNF